MTNEKDISYRYKQAIWLYIFLLIFEGALRKWFLPGLATPLLLIREPIVIGLTAIAFNRGLIKLPFVFILVCLSTISFFLTLIVGHQNLWTALYGWRIYLFHIPFIFVIAKLLDRADLLRVGRVVLYISIPMTTLIIGQFYAPQSAWINRGIGGDTDGAGFGGAMGFFRPPGTFSFTSGYVMYQLLVGVFLFYYLINNRLLPKAFQIHPWVIGLMLVCYIVTIPYSISRTHLFQTIVLIAFMSVGVILHPVAKIRSSFLKTIPIIVVSLLLIMSTGIMGDSSAAFEERFESANETEGGMEGVIGNRYFGSFIRGILNEDAPFWGYGLGLGTNVGANLAGGSDGMFSFFNGEEEWPRLTSESGLLLGWCIIAIRLFLSGFIALKAYHTMRSKKDMLPSMLTAGVLITLPQGSLGIPTNLGFIVLLSGLTLASLRNTQKAKKHSMLNINNKKVLN